MIEWDNTWKALRMVRTEWNLPSFRGSILVSSSKPVKETLSIYDRF